MPKPTFIDMLRNINNALCVRKPTAQGSTLGNTVTVLLKPLRCPHCGDPVTKPMLKQKGHLKDFLKSKVFPCPHCEGRLLYPEQADTTLSAGIFVAVILAPLFHYWQVAFITPPQLFALGVVITVIGIFTQKLEIPDEQE